MRLKQGSLSVGYPEEGGRNKNNSTEARAEPWAGSGAAGLRHAHRPAIHWINQTRTLRTTERTSMLTHGK